MPHNLKSFSLVSAALVLMAVGRPQDVPQPAVGAPPAPLVSADHAATSRIVPPDRVSARRIVVAELNRAIERSDYEEAALLNSVLAQEAFDRAFRVERAWIALRDPETGLFPKSPDENYWNGKDTAADCFPFLFLASHFLDSSNEGLWLQTLARERELSGPLPRKIAFQPARLKKEPIDRQIFGGAEYVKDGLLAITERAGRGPWFDRMEEVVHEIIERASIRTKAGKVICATTTEVNGDMLQSLPRLYWATRKQEYLDMAEATAEAYLFEVLPAGKGIPARDWDFAGATPVQPFFRLRDHGNEIVPGLSEVYMVEKALGRPQAATYHEPLKKLLDLLLTTGRSKDGLWFTGVYTDSHEPTDDRIIDNWGYLCNAYLTFDIADGTHLYDAEIQRAMRAAASYKSYTWEGDTQDGYADSIESMLYLLPRFDLPECRQWVDDEIEVLFSMQSGSGFVDRVYLDGNFIRTALLYAGYKTQGVMIDPWRQDVRAGAFYDKSSNTLFLHLAADAPWSGVLRFDGRRHAVIWGMPVDYPRLNSTPEWYTVDPAATYTLADEGTGKRTSISGSRLFQGYAVTLDGKEPLRLTIVKQE